MSTAKLTFVPSDGNALLDPSPITIDSNGVDGATDVAIVIDGVHYGSLFFSDWAHTSDRVRKGWRIELGQYDEIKGYWTERNPIGRLGGWIEKNDSGYYPVLDGQYQAVARDGSPVTFDTPREAYALLYAASVTGERDIPQFSKIDVIEASE